MGSGGAPGRIPHCGMGSGGAPGRIPRCGMGSGGAPGRIPHCGMGSGGAPEYIFHCNMGSVEFHGAIKGFLGCGYKHILFLAWLLKSGANGDLGYKCCGLQPSPMSTETEATIELVTLVTHKPRNYLSAVLCRGELFFFFFFYY